MPAIFLLICLAIVSINAADEKNETAIAAPKTQQEADASLQSAKALAEELPFKAIKKIAEKAEQLVGKTEKEQEEELKKAIKGDANVEKVVEAIIALDKKEDAAQAFSLKEQAKGLSPEAKEASEKVLNVVLDKTKDQDSKLKEIHTVVEKLPAKAKTELAVEKDTEGLDKMVKKKTNIADVLMEAISLQGGTVPEKTKKEEAEASLQFAKTVLEELPLFSVKKIAEKTGQLSDYTVKEQEEELKKASKGDEKAEKAIEAIIETKRKEDAAQAESLKEQTSNMSIEAKEASDKVVNVMQDNTKDLNSKLLEIHAVVEKLPAKAKAELAVEKGTEELDNVVMQKSDIAHVVKEAVSLGKPPSLDDVGPPPSNITKKENDKKAYGYGGE